MTLSATEPRATTRRTPWLALPLAALIGAGFFVGCDDADPDSSAMVMQPSQTPATQPVATTRPDVLETPTSQPSDDEAEPAEEALPNAFIIIDDEPYEFPPAKLWLEREGDRVIAQLYSDDPPEAVSRDWQGDSFYFEMGLELPEQPGVASDEGVSPEELAAAEWVYRSDTSERVDTLSGIFLGGNRHLQPTEVAVTFEPLDENLVVVTLFGRFAEFDKSQPRKKLPERHVSVRAVLSAEAIER